MQDILIHVGNNCTEDTTGDYKNIDAKESVKRLLEEILSQNDVDFAEIMYLLHNGNNELLEKISSYLKKAREG